MITLKAAEYMYCERIDGLDIIHEWSMIQNKIVSYFIDGQLNCTHCLPSKQFITQVNRYNFVAQFILDAFICWFCGILCVKWSYRWHPKNPKNLLIRCMCIVYANIKTFLGLPFFMFLSRQQFALRCNLFSVTSKLYPEPVYTAQEKDKKVCSGLAHGTSIQFKDASTITKYDLLLVTNRFSNILILIHIYWNFKCTIRRKKGICTNYGWPFLFTRKWTWL